MGSRSHRHYPPEFHRDVWQNPYGRACRRAQRRVHLSPQLPFGWVDYPPGVNRLIGPWWLANLVYPQLFPDDLAPTANSTSASITRSRPTPKSTRVLGEPGLTLARARAAWPGSFAAVVIAGGWSSYRFAMGRSPDSPAHLLRRAWAKRPRSPRGLPPTSRPSSSSARPARLGRAAGGRRAGGGGRGVPGHVPQSPVSPDILGASAGAALGAVLAIFFSLPSSPSRPWPSWAAWWRLCWSTCSGLDAGPTTPADLLLTGVVVGTLLGRRHRADGVPGGPLQPAARHHLLAAGKPVREFPTRGPPYPCSLPVACPVACLPIALRSAAERDVPHRRSGRTLRPRRGACARWWSPGPRW